MSVRLGNTSNKTNAPHPQNQNLDRATKLVAFVGPQGSGKSTLARRLLDTLPGAGPAATRTSLGALTMDGLFGTRLLQATPSLILADCPGHPEQMDEALAWASVADLTLVVVDPQPNNLPRTAALLHELARHRRPHAIVINQVLEPTFNLDVMVSGLGKLCCERVLLQQVPLHQDKTLVGLVQLYNEKATLWRADKGETPVALPAENALEEAVARQEFLESLAEFDDRLLVDLLEERLPSIRLLAADLQHTVSHDEVVPLYLADAAGGFGMHLLHEALETIVTSQCPELVQSIGQAGDGEPLAIVVQPGEIPKRGAAAICRLIRGPVHAGTTMGPQRIAHLHRPTPTGAWQDVPDNETLGAGSICLIPRAEGLVRGQILGTKEPKASLPMMVAKTPVYAQSVTAGSNLPLTDKLMANIDRLIQECPSLARSLGDPDLHEVLLWAPGPYLLDAAQKQLADRFGHDIRLKDPSAPFRERMVDTAMRVQGRYKHQNGGHGAFGDVFMDFEPLPPGSGFVFEAAISGGVVPRQFFAAIEEGVCEAMHQGPHGHPVLDLKARLVDGSTHAVDSSDMAFKQAARAAFRIYAEKTPAQILEPMVLVRCHVPEILSNTIVQLVPSLRGNILEFLTQSRSSDEPLFYGWHAILCLLPQSVVPDFIRVTRSQTQGLVSFTIEHPDADQRYRIKSF
jgi:elongation factor G